MKKIDNDEVSSLAFAIAEGTYLNEFRKNVFCKISVSYRPVFKKIAELGGSTNWRDCFFIRSAEMTELLEGKKIFIPKLVKQRGVVGVYRTEKAVNKMLDQEIVNDFVEYIESMHGSNTVRDASMTSVKGHSANKGKVKGIVKIILGSKDFYKLNLGEILVTTMTSVDFVPVMERAAAFVTNEGGITSHASIVAREMNKPCIIGTKNATQVLKDGMEVEVDADNGVVRIVSSSDDLSVDAYQRLFQTIAGGLTFFAADVFGQYYKNLWSVQTFKDGVWTSHIPNSVKEQTLKDGLELYSSAESFDKYKKDFENYRKKSENIFNKILLKETLTKEDIEKYFKAAITQFEYYSKTEFFYTDDAFTELQKEKNKELEKNLGQLESVKNPGREYLNKVFFGKDCYLHRLLKKIAEQLDLNEKELHGHSVPEVIDLFEGKSIQKDLAEERLDSFTIISSRDSVRYLSGDESRDFIQKFLGDHLKTNRLLKGVVANSGHIKAKVKVIPADYYSDFSALPKIFGSMDAGDVLVAETTSPELMPACKKASAIITNQGGLLSHAAIVSREMGIPCIVGMGNATELLKDGMEVEVDADNGIVKILNDERDNYIFMWSISPMMPSNWATLMVLFGDSESFPKSTIFQYFNGEVITAYMLKSEIESHKAKEGDKYLDPKYYEEYVTKFDSDIAEWWKWIRKVETKEYSDISKEELREDAHQFTEYQRDAISYFGSTRPEFTYAAEQKLEKILEPVFGENWADAFGVITTSIEKDDIQRELVSWKSVDITNDQALLAHVSKYPWLVFGQFDEEKVLEFLRNREIDMHSANTTLSERQEEIFSQLGNNQDEVIYLAKFLQEQAVRRMDIKAYWAGSYYVARNLWRRIAKDTDIELWDLLKYVTPPEIEEILTGEFTKDIKELIKKRRQAYAIIYEPGFDEIKMLSGDEAIREFKKRIKPVEEGIRQFEGQVASTGICTGKVRKVIAGDLEQLEKSTREFQKGEILVTSMTQPNMMVIANRAAAIVADEGGITSHAAIIARELSIPCIVGCQIAMEVLKDGDEIEVDAKKGIVNIL